MKIMYLRRKGIPFGMLAWDETTMGWSLCNDKQPNGDGKPDRFTRAVGKARAMQMAAAGHTLDDAVRFALVPSQSWQWKQREVKNAIKRVTYPILAERAGIAA